MKNESPYIHRDISWLSFNYRVLQEAKDPNVPLMERIKFLAIYSSNLNEFFSVRVANHRNILLAGKKTRKEISFEPEDVLKQILKIVNIQQEEFSHIYENEIIPALKREKINVLTRKQLDENQIEFIENYFADELVPHVQPMLLVGEKIRPFLGNSTLYLAVLLRDKEKSGDNYDYAIVKIPSDLFPRFIQIPSKKSSHNDLILIDDVIRHNVRLIFPGFDVKDSYSIKLSRDAELYIDDEYSGDLISKIKKSLGKRKVGVASRMVVDREAPDHFVKYLQKVLEVDKRDVMKEGRYHNNFDFFKFPTFGKVYLQDQLLPDISYDPLEKAENIFDEIAKKDHLIHVPYHSYESVIRFFEQAATDPKVTHIKILQYRVAKVSRIMEALKLAVKNGKQVFAFVEIKARFDEENNLNWGERLEASGVQVKYSLPGLKVHSKMALVRRNEDKKINLYLYFSTGNFNENTAQTYSDLGVFTVSKELSIEALRVFSYLETKKLPQKKFELMLVGTFNLKSSLIQLIDNEIENATKGKKASITLKMNSLQDGEMIDKLYEASQKGVEVKLIIRGICSLVPGIKGWSNKIHTISIVDRYLEHARIFIFENNGDEKLYLSSADWMVRNLHHRIETVIPILDKDLKKEIKYFVEMQLRDNVKSRKIDVENNNHYVGGNKELAFRSQLETYFYIKRAQGL